jgi:hypothetical protein
MLRSLAILVVLFALAQKPLPVEGGHKQENPQTKSADTQPPAPPPPTSEIDKENAANAERYAYYKAHPKEYLKAAIAPANASNWILAGLGFAASLIGIFTLLAIKTQSDLQAAALRQWIEVQITGSETDKDLTAFGNLVKDAQVRVRFKAINETSFPLTIVKIVTKVSYRRVEGRLQWEVFEVKERAIIPPSKAAKESSHPFFVFLDLDESAVRAYVDQTMIVSVNGVISFENAAGNIEEQSFGKFTRIGLFIQELRFQGTEPSKVEQKT